jgi:hypothetical protein
MSASRNDVVKNVKRKDVLTSENADDLAQSTELLKPYIEFSNYIKFYNISY